MANNASDRARYHISDSTRLREPHQKPRVLDANLVCFEFFNYNIYIRVSYRKKHLNSFTCFFFP